MQSSIDRYKANIAEAEVARHHLVAQLGRTGSSTLAWPALQEVLADLARLDAVLTYYRGRLNAARKYSAKNTDVLSMGPLAAPTKTSKTTRRPSSARSHDNDFYDQP